MFRIVLIAILLAAADWNSAAAQMPGDNLLEVRRWQRESIKLKNIVSALTKDSRIVRLTRVWNDEVAFVGVGIGETWLEIEQSDNQKTVLKVRVTPQAVSKTDKPDLTASAGPSGGMAAKPEKPSRPGSRPLLSASRFELSIDSQYGMDTERIHFGDAGNLEDQLRQGARSQNGEQGEAHQPTESKSAARSHQDDIMTVRRSFITIPFSLRYELSRRNSLTVAVPFIRRQDEVKLGDVSTKSSSQGLGDIQISFERMFSRLLRSRWDGSLQLNAGLPTGRSPYNSAGNKSPLGTGHYEIGSVFGVRRIFDPVVFNASFGINHTLPRTVQGARIKPGHGYSVQTGVAYALSDRWVISEQLNYSRRPNVFLSSPIDTGTVVTDQAYLSHSLIYNPKSDTHTFRFMFNVGLNHASTDYGLGLTYTYRFGDKRERERK